MQIRQSNIDGVIFGHEHNSELFIRKVSFPAGYSEENYHMHPNSFEYYLVLKGSLIFVAGEEVSVSEGDIVFFKTGEQHRISKVASDVEMLLIKKIGVEKIEL